jgi:ketosteroid isomerase-like protein
MAVAKDEVEAVRSANERFYRAFEKLDMPAMAAVWAKTDYVKCIHPGWGLLVGWDAVRASWEIIFRNTGEIKFTLTEVEVELRGALAWVTLTENILSQADGRVGATSVLTTNLFERTGAGWLMIHHHASHVMMPPARGDSETIH